jgi:hypothetical protein
MDLRHVLMISMLLAFTAARAQDAVAPALSSQRDYSDNATRDMPIACKPGDLERQPGKSLAQVFASDWPAPPEPASEQATVQAQATELGRLSWPRGLEGKRALVVMAVLVAADGKPLRAEPLCSTAMGFDISARRAAMGGKYQPAKLDGMAIVGPAIVVIKFEGARKRGGARGDSDD